MPHSNQAEDANEEPENGVDLPLSLQLDHGAFIAQLAAFHKERGYVASP